MLIIKPGIIFRKDTDRIIAYPSKREDNTNKISVEDFVPAILHPNAAIVMTLFDGKRSISDVSRIWGYLSGMEDKSASNLVDSLITNYRHLLTDGKMKDSHSLPYKSEDFIMDGRKVDLTGPRCKIPTDMILVPTLNCSQNCIYCYADTRSKENTRLPVSRICELIRECKELRFASVNISGGEPFLHPHIFDILKAIRDAGFHPQIPTKYPLDKKQVYLIRKMGYDSFQISLDAVEPDLSDFLMGVHGHFNLIMKTIQYASEAQLKISIVSVVTKYNINHIPDMIEKLMSLPGIFRVRLAGCGRSIYRDNGMMLPSYEEYQQLEEQVNEWKDKYEERDISLSYMKDHTLMSIDEKKEFYENRAQCSAGRYTFTLLPDGTVTPCEELYYHPAFVMGNLKTQSVMEMWDSDEWERLLNPNREMFNQSPCGECSQFEECHTGKGRCWKRALASYGKADFPDPYCPLAPPGKRIC